MRSESGERARWNEKYAAGEAQKMEPDSLLVEACAGLNPGTALDLAGGAGRHALWLADRGWSVTLTDISDEAIRIAQQRIQNRVYERVPGKGAPIACRCEPAAETLRRAIHDGERFDLIAVFWFLDRALFPAVEQLLAPRGLLVCRTFTAGHERFRGREVPDYALQPGELRKAFPALAPILSREANGVAELVAQAR